MNDYISAETNASYDDVCTLIKVIEQRDEYGRVISNNEQRTEIFCARVQMYRSEFFKAGQLNLSPAFCIVCDNTEYNGEQRCEYNSEVFAIYSTQERADGSVLLFLQREAGVDE